MNQGDINRCYVIVYIHGLNWNDKEKISNDKEKIIEDSQCIGGLIGMNKKHWNVILLSIVKFMGILRLTNI